MKSTSSVEKQPIENNENTNTAAMAVATEPEVTAPPAFSAVNQPAMSIQSHTPLATTSLAASHCIPSPLPTQPLAPTTPPAEVPGPAPISAVQLAPMSPRKSKEPQTSKTPIDVPLPIQPPAPTILPVPVHDPVSEICRPSPACARNSKEPQTDQSPTIDTNRASRFQKDDTVKKRQTREIQTQGEKKKKRTQSGTKRKHRFVVPFGCV